MTFDSSKPSADNIPPTIITQIHSKHMKSSDAKLTLQESGRNNHYRKGHINIQTMLNGVTSLEELDRRLNRFYLDSEIKKLPSYIMIRSNAAKYFRFLKLFNEGLKQSVISQLMEVNNSNISRWRHGKRIPKLVRLTRQIPATCPGFRHKWLPTELTSGWKMRGVIPVPEAILSFNDVRKVLSCLVPIDPSQMRQWRSEFGSMSKEDAFMYLLGIIISDGTFVRQKTPYAIRLSLSSKYDWSERLLNAVAYRFALLGVRTSALKKIDRPYSVKGEAKKRVSKQIYIQSQNTPILNWVRKATLGVIGPVSKSYSDIKIEWALDAPEHARISLLQGLADGDGFAGLGVEMAEITTINKQQPYTALLLSLGVMCRSSKHGVHIARKAAIARAIDLPMFLYATSRMKTLLKLHEMLQARKQVNLEENERSLIVQLYQKGHSITRIKLELWNQLRKSRPNGTIRRVVKKSQRKVAETDAPPVEKP